MESFITLVWGENRAASCLSRPRPHDSASLVCQRIEIVATLFERTLLDKTLDGIEDRQSLVRVVPTRLEQFVQIECLPAHLVEHSQDSKRDVVRIGQLFKISFARRHIRPARMMKFSATESVSLRQRKLSTFPSRTDNVLNVMFAHPASPFFGAGAGLAGGGFFSLISPYPQRSHSQSGKTSEGLVVL